MTNDTPDPWEIRRPDVLLDEVSRRHPFDVPRTLLACVDGPWEDQRLTASVVLWRRPPSDEAARLRVTERALARLGLTWSHVRYADLPLVVPIVVRPGPSWMSWDETEALLGLRYGSNLCSVRQGALLTVTARGWYAPLDELAGEEPFARWAPGAVA